MISKIATVAVYVENQQAVIQFWTEQVGFELRANHRMGPSFNWVEVAPKGAESCLVIYPKALMKDWERRSASIVFVCPDAEQAYTEMSARGVQFTEAPKVMAWGTFATFRDPDGNEFLLKSDPKGNA